MMVDPNPSATSLMVLQGGMYGMKLFTSGVFCMVFIFYSEVYPTIARATGFATVMTVGRCGSIAAPLLFEFMRKVSSPEAFFYLIMVATVGNLALFGCQTYTKDIKLEDDFQDTETAEQLPIRSARTVT